MSYQAANAHIIEHRSNPRYRNANRQVKRSGNEIKLAIGCQVNFTTTTWVSIVVATNILWFLIAVFS